MLANFKNAIRARRLRAYEVAAALGICPSTLSEIISGQRQVTPEFRERAARVMGTSEDWLFEELELAAAPAMPIDAVHVGSVA